MTKRLKGDSVSRGLFWGCAGVFGFGAFLLFCASILTIANGTDENEQFEAQPIEPASAQQRAIEQEQPKPSSVTLQRKKRNTPRIREGMSLAEAEKALGADAEMKRAMGKGAERVEVYEWTMQGGHKVEAEFTAGVLTSYELIQAPQVSIAPASPTNPGVNFATFTAALSELNNRVEIASGYRFVEGARDLGDGIVEVTMSDLWWNESLPSERESNLTTIFNLWKTAEGTGLPITVYLVDQSGDRSMFMRSR